MTTLAPVVLFVYARPDHTRQVLLALRANALADQTDLWIYCDAAKRPAAQTQVDAVRAVVRELATGFRTVNIIEREHNVGLARSIIGGVTELLQQRGRVIVLEDDLVTSPHFLRYMNEALDRYQTDKRIYSISGYSYPDDVMRYPDTFQDDVYLTVRNSSWGWATWIDRWADIDWQVSDYDSFRKSRKQRRAFNRGGDDMAEMLDMQMAGIIDSWAIRFSYAQFKAGCYSVAPRRSFVVNVGLDGSGVHCGATPALSGNIGLAPSQWQLPERLTPDLALIKAFAQVNAIPWSARFKTGLKKAIRISLEWAGVDTLKLKRRLGRPT
jgi:Glycosyl transferase family 2